jgi:prepilin-type N-terminal cleavage/methylation domain-containing protein
MAASRNGAKRDGGFTLVELLVVLAIVAILGTAIGTVVAVTQRTTYEQRMISGLQDDLRRTTERIVSEMRKGSAVTIEAPDANTVTVTVQIRSDLGANLQFGLLNGNIWIDDPAQVICSHIAKLIVTQAPDARLIDIEFISTTDIPGVEHGLPVSLQTSVMLRNR